MGHPVDSTTQMCKKQLHANWTRVLQLL